MRRRIVQATVISIAWSLVLTALVVAQQSAAPGQSPSQGRADTPATPSGQASPVQGQEGMEGMRGGQESMGPMR
jgi:hypothetical protein